MLVLSRRIGESILIGKDVIVTVVADRGDQVRLGITAPRSVLVLREELTGAERQRGSIPPKRELPTDATDWG
jgi:carbon storage regulator